jgi:TonB-linked SusC/RagA family outer membrane protein
MKQKFNFKKVRFFFSLFLLFSVIVASAQSQKTITGTVLSSDDNSPLPGATVLEKGTSNGTTTDFDGIFSLDVASDATTLVISFMGFQDQEVQITSDNMTIILQTDVNALDEVVVVGYGTQRKSDLVSSVAKADLKKALVTPTSDVNEMLRGRVAGLKVEVGSGSLRPGGESNIVLRGRGSIEGNTNGIYVVNGVIRDGGISDINPDDIKSIEVLKDASAQAIYGSRAVNGVVLITTKTGSNNKINVSYHGYYTQKNVTKNFDVFNGQDFAQLRREAFRASDANNAYPIDSDIFSEVELASIANNDFVNWDNELLGTGTVNSQSIGISGGTELTKVYASVNYFNESGIIPTSDFTKKNLRLNLDQKISNKVSAIIDLNIFDSYLERPVNVNVITMSPLGKAYDDNGDIVRYPSGEELSATSPLWNLREHDDDDKGNGYVVTVIPKIEITDDLTYQLKASLSRNNSERGQYFTSLSSTGDKDNGIARIKNTLRESYLFENILTYDKRINEDHAFNITLVQAMDENKYSQTFTEGKGFTNEDLGYDGISNAINSFDVVRNKSKVRTSSFMGRARYNLLDRYMLTATLRADGASVNAADHKWTYNPAFAVAWKIHNENFLENVDQINELKLRLSYGSLANALKNPYTSLFSANGYHYVFNGESTSGYSPSGVLPNSELKHETVTTFNIGLDFNVFNNFLTGSIEYYNSKTKDLLLRRGVPSITGYDFTYFNAGELQNKGFELGLTFNIFDKDDFRWSVSTIYSNNKNELIKLYDDANGDPILEDNKFHYYVGQSIGVLRHYQFDGIWQEGEDFANAPQANPESTDPQANLRAGDIRIKDTNGLDSEGNLTGQPDGKITEDDKVFTDRNPDWFGSLSTSLYFKGFDLFIDFYAVEGATRRNVVLSDYNSGGALRGHINGVEVPYYTPENPSSTFPRPNSDGLLHLESLAIQDASYFRMRTLRLGYSLPDSIIDKLKMEQIKVYFTGTNLFTKTDFIGYSPEVSIRSAYSSADRGYPDSRGFTLGLKVKL